VVIGHSDTENQIIPQVAATSDSRLLSPYSTAPLWLSIHSFAPGPSAGWRCCWCAWPRWGVERSGGACARRWTGCTGAVRDPQWAFVQRTELTPLQRKSW